MKLSLPRPGTFEIQSDDLNSESWDGDDDSRSAKSVSVDLKSISEEKKEDPDDQEEGIAIQLLSIKHAMFIIKLNSC